MRDGRAVELAAALTLCAGVWLGFATAGLPPVVASSAALTAFSAQRAERDLRMIAATPHPAGTAAHDRLRDYLADRLRSLGCEEVHIQSATGFNTLDGPVAATVANVVCRKRGERRGPALLLTAHYDAVPRSPGAGDDGAGVAAILETMRALGSGPQLENDIILVLSDAEEDGLLGAEAFVDLHPWARDVGAVLNFEGRGDAGPVFMFQTSPGNARLIDALATSVPDARTNSLTGEIYRHLPSDTDLSIWLHSPFAGGALNFAHVGGYSHYHTPIDDMASIDLRVLQQMGDYALGLARTLGQSDLRALRTQDRVYFNAPLVGVLRYPGWLALPAGIIAAVTVIVTLAWFGTRRKIMSWRGIRAGVRMFAITLAAPTAITFLGWRAVILVHPAYRDILQHDPYNSRWYLLGFSALTVAVALEIQRRFRLKARPIELLVAPVVAWSVVGVAIAVFLPGASYLFLWPLLAAGGGAIGSLGPTGASRPTVLAILLPAIPLLVLWAPLIQSLEVALTADSLALCMLLAALMLTLLVIPIYLLGAIGRWAAIGAALVSIAAYIGAEATAGFNPARKRPDSLALLADADSSHAWWVSFDQSADAWTGSALGPHPGRRTFDAYRIAPPGMLLLATAAKWTPLALSPVRTLDDRAVSGGRRIHLHVARSGSGEFLTLLGDGVAAVTAMTINGRDLLDGTGDRYRPAYRLGGLGLILRYFGVPEEGVDLRFTVQSPGPFALHVVTAVEGLPPSGGIDLPKRPPEFMSKPFVPTDMILTRWPVPVPEPAPR